MIGELGKLTHLDVAVYGGKALALDRLIKMGVRVPGGIAVPADYYRMFVNQSGLQNWLTLNLEKKPLDRMRWEELWDLAHSIRHRFIKTPVPEALLPPLSEALAVFGGKAAAVRSSSPGEDSAAFSFAGLHDSLVNLRGTAALLEALKEIWASLWTDRALMYFREMGLSVTGSAMPVVVQEFIPGEWSGVLFTRDFRDPRRAVMETVPGFNEGLVSGEVEPDRIVVDRESGKVISRDILGRESGFDAEAPLKEALVEEVVETGLRLEKAFGYPLDMEWTVAGGEVYILQVRPVTAGEDGPDTGEGEADQRPWYRTLTKTFAELGQIRDKIQDELLPDLEASIRTLGETDLESLDDPALAAETEARRVLTERWDGLYRDYFIPFAHGVRLFGSLYSRAVQPESPFEFIELLVHDDFRSLRRNRQLQNLATALKDFSEPPSPDAMPASWQKDREAFILEYGQSSFFEALIFDDSRRFMDFLFALSRAGASSAAEDQAPRRKSLEDGFLGALEALGRQDGEDILAMARLSYRLRDDDNLAVARIRGEYLRAHREGERRKGGAGEDRAGAAAPGESRAETASGYRVVSRQVTGTAAGPGLASGPARVVTGPEDLFQVRQGEILVCDSIDPNITFVVPLAAGIVERRGGMLVHGAIIAREYGIPCVTGVAGAVDIIAPGDRVTVDGFSGIVTIHRDEDRGHGLPGR